MTSYSKECTHKALSIYLAKFCLKYILFSYFCKRMNTTRFEVLGVVLLKFQLLRYVMLCYWVSVSWCFEDTVLVT